MEADSTQNSQSAPIEPEGQPEVSQIETASSENLQMLMLKKEINRMIRDMNFQFQEMEMVDFWKTSNPKGLSSKEKHDLSLIRKKFLQTVMTRVNVRIWRFIVLADGQ